MEAWWFIPTLKFGVEGVGDHCGEMLVPGLW